MFKVDIENKKLIKLDPVAFASLKLKERYDIQEWIESAPQILGEELLIISKELFLPSGKRLDLLAIDKEAKLVIIELKRDDTGNDVEWQAIKYTSYCSSFTTDDIFKIYAEYYKTSDDEAHDKIESFIEAEIETLNKEQRIILVSKEFNSEVISAILWLREYGIEIECIRITPYIDSGNNLFVKPEIIIPLLEAKDYIEKKESRQKDYKRTNRSNFSLEKSNLPTDQLKNKLLDTFKRKSDLTPRLIEFFNILSEGNFKRDEIKQKLYESGIGTDLGQSGRYLSNISQFITKKSNPHLRQIIEFSSGGTEGELKDNYKILPDYIELVKDLISDIKKEKQS